MKKYVVLICLVSHGLLAAGQLVGTLDVIAGRSNVPSSRYNGSSSALQVTLTSGTKNRYYTGGVNWTHVGYKLDDYPEPASLYLAFANYTDWYAGIGKGFHLGLPKDMLIAGLTASVRSGNEAFTQRGLHSYFNSVAIAPGAGGWILYRVPVYRWLSLQAQARMHAYTSQRSPCTTYNLGLSFRILNRNKPK